MQIRMYFFLAGFLLGVPGFVGASGVGLPILEEACPRISECKKGANYTCLVGEAEATTDLYCMRAIISILASARKYEMLGEVFEGIRHRRPEEVQALVNWGFARPQGGETDDEASRRLKFYLEMGADPNYRGDSVAQLFVCATRGNVECVEILLGKPPIFWTLDSVTLTH